MWDYPIVTTEHFYKPANTSHWDDVEGGFSDCVTLLDLNDAVTVKDHGVRYGLVGFCCDAGAGDSVGVSGAADAPEAIRAALQSLQLHNQDAMTFYDVGDVVCLKDSLCGARDCLAHVVSTLRQHQMRPIVLGGGTETSVGHYRGLVDVNPCSHLGLVSFSSCLSLLSSSDTSSRTAFWEIGEARKKEKLDFNYTCLGVQSAANTSEEFEHAHEHGLRYMTADVLAQGSVADIFAMLEDALKDSEAVFLSINLNVFSSAFAPGVVRPQPLGLAPWHILPLIKCVMSTGQVSGMEILGLHPQSDPQGLTAKLAANLVYQLIYAQ